MTKLLTARSRISLLVCAALLAAACDPYSSSPPHATVKLTFVQISQSDLAFELKNGTLRAIWFDGNSEGERVRPLDPAVDFECNPEGSLAWAKSRPVIGSWAKVENIRVAPRQALQLIVHSDFVVQFKNGVCRFELQLSDGLVVASNDFKP